MKRSYSFFVKYVSADYLYNLFRAFMFYMGIGLGMNKTPILCPLGQRSR